MSPCLTVLPVDPPAAPPAPLTNPKIRATTAISPSPSLTRADPKTPTLDLVQGRCLYVRASSGQALCPSGSGPVCVHMGHTHTYTAHAPHTQSHAFAHTHRPIQTSYTGVVMARLIGTDGTDWPRRCPRRFDHAVCWLIIHLCVCICICTYTNKGAYACTCVYMHMCINGYIYICIGTHAWVHAHTHTHTNTVIEQNQENCFLTDLLGPPRFSRRKRPGR